MAADSNEFIDLHISTVPWEQIEVDAFVCPINSEGLTRRFPASKIRTLAGLNLEELLQPHTPLAIGAALVTPAGNMAAKYLIHVPNTETSGGPVQVEDILRATSAVLVAARIKRFTSLAIPLMGAFENGIPAEEAARAIYSEFKAYRGPQHLRIFLMAKDKDDLEVFEMALEGSLP